jgi:two-component system, sensor histidine kinase and response regulator
MSARKTILVVDDIAANRNLLRQTLEPCGYEVLLASNGEMALKVVLRTRPDLVLMDVNMPEMDGYEACRRLKGMAGLTEVPVIFITANDDSESLIKGFEAGGVDYIAKPFKEREVLMRVRTHVTIHTLTHALREMNEEKNEFMGMAAHDLRNPLGAVQGYTELLLEEEGMDRAEQVALLRRIHEAAGRMATMVQNLLDTNRIERGELKFHLVPADLRTLVSSVVETQRPRAEAKQQTMHVEAEEGPARVAVDPTAMMQVLENLVSNAIKYSPAGKKIFLRLKSEAPDVRLEVQDEGPGLSLEDQKKLFGKFARLSAKPTGGEQSTGLGLSIVKKMVEAMEGKVWCQSEPGHGATFIVTLPEAANASASP